MEHFLSQLWQRWQMRGASPEARRLYNPDGWLLTLCFRAKVTAWLLFLMFSGLLTAVFILQIVDPQDRATFWLETVGFSAFSIMGLYYLIFVYRYRVILDESEVVLRRFLLPTRRLGWVDIVAFDYLLGDDVLKLHSRHGNKIGVYMSLNGLSAIRRCLAAFAPLNETLKSWETTDRTLCEIAPSWRCDDKDLEDDPFDPLGTWKTGSIA